MSIQSRGGEQETSTSEKRCAICGAPWVLGHRCKASCGDQRDFEVMLACAHDKAALDAQASGEEDNGMHISVCLRIHHGYMAFGS